ncbi:hypothetical protein [Flagellimonas sp. GZD32]|uniref:hypothetical protein n=1 Tax=Flagellimonas cixiensis TaxID=3228750 RepID=UPI0035C8F57E
MKLATIMTKNYLIILLIILPSVCSAQEYSQEKIKLLIEKLDQMSAFRYWDHRYYENGKYEKVKATSYRVVGKWTDNKSYADTTFVDNSTHKTFLEIVEKSTLKDLFIMSNHKSPNIRVYAFWAFIKRKDKRNALRILQAETNRKQEKVWYDGMGDSLEEFTTIRLMINIYRGLL